MPIASSYKDPSGFMFTDKQVLYRAIRPSYAENFHHLINSGLYHLLVSKGLLIRHVEVGDRSSNKKDTFKVIRPEFVEFITYPFEWPFSAWKDAALATLRIQEIALDFGMSLKDASAFNIQFVSGKACLIDTLSFEKYKEDEPWCAYRQFCEHFLGPLALMAKTGDTFGRSFQLVLDGIPLKVVSSRLPTLSWVNLGLLLNVHFHALAQERKELQSANILKSKRRFGIQSMRGLILSLKRTIEHLDFSFDKTSGWNEYYFEKHHEQNYFNEKIKIVEGFLDFVRPNSVLDLGSNTGLFSQLAATKCSRVISIDESMPCVEINYRTCKSKALDNILPLLIDITNPSPALGWQNLEITSFLARAKVDLAMCLGLLHHLAISHNLPFDKIADLVADLCTWVIIEFIPKEDDKVIQLLEYREDIFSNYRKEHFEKVFGRSFRIKEVARISNSKREIYLMQKKSN